MTTIADIEQRLDAVVGGASATPAELLGIGESVLETWVRAKGEVPTTATREGFRLLGLHRQGASDDPSFNACRETCRELAYHYNLLEGGHIDGIEDRTAAVKMMALVANHLFLFVTGKLEEHELGDFCCSSKPVRNSHHKHLKTETHDA